VGNRGRRKGSQGRAEDRVRGRVRARVQGRPERREESSTGRRRSTFNVGTEIGKHLRRMGCKMLAEPESFFVVGEGGPLEPGEEDRARAWAARSLGRTQRATST
jgi:hypothetical protein